MVSTIYGQNFEKHHLLDCGRIWKTSRTVCPAAPQQLRSNSSEAKALTRPPNFTDLSAVKSVCAEQTDPQEPKYPSRLLKYYQGSFNIVVDS